MYIRDIISKKRRKETLTEEEMKFFIFGYFKGEISESQASALLTAMYIYKLSDEELKYFINSISETGEELEFYRVSSKLVDIHSLGGVSDKITLILLSILDSLNLTAAKVIGRELGFEDRLNSLKGYKLENNVKDFKVNLQKNNVGILKSIKELAPVENKLYKLRHEIACDNSVELIASSILSQKMALGFANIFFEITYGKNAYVKTLKDARILSKKLINVGNSLLRNVGCCITRMDEPVGDTFGNLLELKEVYDFLNGEKIADIENMVLEFGSVILRILGYCKDYNKSKNIILDVIDSRRALSSFENLLAIQGGNIEILKNDVVAKNIIPIISNTEGYIAEIDVNQIRNLAKYLNAIRTKEDDKLDIGAGIKFNKKVGNKINKGDIVGYIYTNVDTKIQYAVEQVRKAVIISDSKIKVEPRVIWKE